HMDEGKDDEGVVDSQVAGRTRDAGEDNDDEEDDEGFRRRRIRRGRRRVSTKTTTQALRKKTTQARTRNAERENFENDFLAFSDFPDFFTRFSQKFRKTSEQFC
ncbi:hypothetical protein U1Q18_024199, partial [Sarracenia purpurea var. burkii]